MRLIAMVRDRRFLLVLIFILAFYLRLWFIQRYTEPLAADEKEYDRLATSILEGKGYVSKSGHLTASRPPGYPLFLATIYFSLGKNYFLVRIIQAVIDSLLCILIFYFGAMLFTPTIGILAAFLATLHLGFIAQSAKILTESLTTFILLSGIIYFYKANKHYGRKIYYFLTGFMIGIVSLVRSNLLILFFLIGIALIYNFFKRSAVLKDAVRYFIIYSVAFLIPILPWTLRNYRVFHALVPISSAQGIAFYSSYKPLDGKIYGFIPHDPITEKANLFSSETERSNYLTKETVKLIIRDPAIPLRMFGLKMAYFFSPFDWELIRNTAVYNYLYVFYFPFFILGSLVFLRKIDEFIFLYLPVFGAVLTSALLFGIPRFRVPIEPYMILLASAAIIYIYQKCFLKRIFIFLLSVFFLANFLLYTNSVFVKQICKMFLKNRGLW